MLKVRGGATAFRQWGQNFFFISFTACSPNFRRGNNIVLPPQPHLSGGKLPPLPYGGAAHAQGTIKILLNTDFTSDLAHFLHNIVGAQLNIAGAQALPNRYKVTPMV